MATINIPTDEAKPGDLATITFGETGETAQLVVQQCEVTAGRLLSNGVRFMGHPFTLAAIHALRPDAAVTISRKVPDLPTEVGSIFRATARIDDVVHGGVRFMVSDGSEVPYQVMAGHGHPDLYSGRWVGRDKIDPTTVELATFTWGAEA